VDTFDHTLPFYLDRTVTMVGKQGRAGPAIAREPRGFLPDAAAFARAWQSDRDAFAMFSANDLAGFLKAHPVPVRIVASDPRPRDREKAVNAASWAFIFTGVLLNASAQLLLKAGTNAVGISSSARRTSFPWA